jgi:hypothetical protein
MSYILRSYSEEFNSVTCSMVFPSVTVFSFQFSLPHIPMDFVFEVDIFKLYFLAVLFNQCAGICSLFSDLVVSIWSSA